MSFQPTSDIRIGTVPWDMSYKDFRYYGSAAAAQTAIASKMQSSVSRNDYTYVRKDNAIKVPYNAEQLYQYNYCMFQNANYGTRWFYSFIVNVEYVNENTSLVYLELDVLQTWFYSCTMKACHVKREHVNDDTIGAHIRDEGLEVGELKCSYTAFLHNNESNSYLVAAHAAEPMRSGGYRNVAGALYTGFPSGLALTTFGGIENGIPQDFVDFMNALSDNGQQDAVAAIYVLPRWCMRSLVNKSDGYGYWVSWDETARIEDLSYNLGYGSIDGYTPKNNKCYVYPYNKVTLGNMFGVESDLRMEYFSSPGTVTLQTVGTCEPNSPGCALPTNYNGVPRYVEGMVQLPPYATVSWVYQTFANAYGQSNAEIMGFKFNSMTELPYFNAALNGMQGLGNGVFGMLQGNVFGGFAQGLTSELNTGRSIINISADLQRQMHQPNTARGGANSTALLVAAASNALVLRRYTMRAEFARQVDDFFSMFGYLVCINKVPNITGRRSWNYVETDGMSLVGGAPSDVIAQIRGLFDNGITIWHTDDVGNYTLDNSIV